jgi:hypothetical protein
LPIDFCFFAYPNLLACRDAVGKNGESTSYCAQIGQAAVGLDFEHNSLLPMLNLANGYLNGV